MFAVADYDGEMGRGRFTITALLNLSIIPHGTSLSVIYTSAKSCIFVKWCEIRPCCTDRSLGGEDWTVYQGPVPDPGQPPCHSKRTKIAVITSRSSGTE